MSSSQLKSLGERLRKTESPSEEDRRALESLRAEYHAPLSMARARLAELGFETTQRIKTSATLIEKLKREKTRLNTIQDIGGIRLVRAMTLNAQDELVERVKATLPVTRVVDRRSIPSNGYRAVHVLLELESFPLELQIRTVAQHEWAQTFEMMGDILGRGIRYGEQVSPDERVKDLVALVTGLSRILYMCELLDADRGAEVDALVAFGPPRREALAALEQLEARGVLAETDSIKRFVLKELLAIRTLFPALALELQAPVAQSSAPIDPKGEGSP